MLQRSVNEEPGVPSRRTTRKRHRIFRKVLALLVVAAVVAAGVGYYEWHHLDPANHFSHLAKIGSKSAAKVEEKSGSFNFLLIGSDARKGDKASHTDSIVLIHADLTNHTYNMISIPRDTRVYMSGYGYTKLTSVQYVSQVKNGTHQGVIDAVKTVSQLTGVPINFYAETNYGGLKNMVDALGGIKMKVPFRVSLTHPWYSEDKGKVFEPGTYSFDGKMVTELVHERDSLPGTDYGRQRLQEEALIGIAKQAMKPSNITKLPALSRSISKFLITTNMTNEDMISFGLGAKDNFHPEKQIHYRQVKGQTAVMYDDVLRSNNDEVVLNQNQLKTIVQKYFTN